MLNKGYLTAKTNRESDEVYTPDYAVYPILKYIKKGVLFGVLLIPKKVSMLKFLKKVVLM